MQRIEIKVRSRALSGSDACRLGQNPTGRGRLRGWAVAVAAALALCLPSLATASAPCDYFAGPSHDPGPGVALGDASNDGLSLAEPFRIADF